MTGLSTEDLMEQKVTSVSKTEQAFSDTAAAVFVITQDDLRRSGVTNIPETLRMVPEVQVAWIDANKWAIKARGVNGRSANKLLVLIDERSYTPTFSGVYWQIQDLVLEDIERTQVIRGRCLGRQCGQWDHQQHRTCRGYPRRFGLIDCG